MVNTADENGCSCPLSKQYSSKCKYLVLEKGKITCSFFYITVDGKKCISHSLVQHRWITGKAMTHPQVHLEENKITNQVDADANCETSEYICHLVSHKNQCKEHGLLLCNFRFLQCYNISEICIYKLNVHGFLIPCRTGEQLQNCRHFQCNIFFKCPGFYCIPWSLVCDNQWDCPGGFDEHSVHTCGVNRSCGNLFKCREDQKCIHLGDTCNGQKDCLLGDDEHFCSLSFNQCALGCTCLIFSVRCFNVTLSFDMFSLYHAVWIESSILSQGLSTITFKNAIILIIQASKLESGCHSFSDVSNVLKIDLSFNMITTIVTGCFKASLNVRTIDLSNNHISIFEAHAFYSQSSLFILNLKNNLLPMLQRIMFDSLSSILILSIRNNTLNTIEENTFLELKLFFVETERHHLCCLLPPSTKCLATIPWHFLCSKLLPSKSLQIAFYSMSGILVGINLLSIFLQ